MSDKRMSMKAALVCGMLGCLCFGAGDWLMIWGDPAPLGDVPFLTAGAAGIAQWRYDLAMALAFPGIALYGVALFALGRYIRGEGQRRAYLCLNALGMTPWLALHLFYVMLLSLFSWMCENGSGSEAVRVCGALYARLGWLVPVSEAVMLPVFLLWLLLQLTGRTDPPRALAAVSVLPVLAALKGVSLLLPQCALRLAYTNGLMSESMLVWFAALLVWEVRKKRRI